jgi:hypothetical protein
MTKTKSKPAKAINPDCMTNPQTAVTECAARFHQFHGAACRGALEIKLLQYFAGLEVSRLYDLHLEIYGETRGGDHAKDAPTLERFVEESLNVTARTARKYRGLFQSVAADQPAIADKLNGTWHKLTLAAPASAESGGSSALTLPSASTFDADTLHAICKHADEWQLHELFDIPTKDAGGVSVDELDAASDKHAAKMRIAKFWLTDFTRRALNNEYLKLPRAQKEALLTTLEETTQALKASLQTKGGKKA